MSLVKNYWNVIILMANRKNLCNEMVCVSFTFFFFFFSLQLLKKYLLIFSFISPFFFLFTFSLQGSNLLFHLFISHCSIVIFFFFFFFFYHNFSFYSLLKKYLEKYWHTLKQIKRGEGSKNLIRIKKILSIIHLFILKKWFCFIYLFILVILL